LSDASFLAFSMHGEPIRAGGHIGAVAALLLGAMGQVGYAALRDFAVTLDSANRRIEFANGASEASPSR
jgi:hypothetical protein